MDGAVPLYSSDGQIIEGIRNFDGKADTVLYTRHKEDCLTYMRHMHSDTDANQDVYQDAVITFIEKVRGEDFRLEKASIKTYLQRICRNQIYVRYKKSKKEKLNDGESNSDETREYTDWLHDINEVNSERVQILQEELLVMRESGSICYELLRKFFFENKTMDQIATLLNYTNADNAKSQKWKCQERLKKQIARRIHNA
jgi:RNA polymerase sigma factor (sigma-70 family)